MVWIVGILSGSYPAFILSRFQPGTALKDHQTSAGTRSTFRKILVLSQYTIAIGLIFCTLVIFKQRQFFLNKDLGFDSKNVLMIDFSDQDAQSRIDLFCEALNSRLDILSYARILGMPSGGSAYMRNFYLEQNETSEQKLAQIVSADHHLLPTMGIRLIQGRNFLPSPRKDLGVPIIVNETSVKELHLENPLGHILYTSGAGDQLIPHEIVGVVEDFHFSSLKNEMHPFFILKATEGFDRISIKLQPEHGPESIDSLKQLWNSLNPGVAFRYAYLEESLETLYDTEKKIGTLFSAFSFLVIFIACMGIFGLASNTAEQKRKEIGIRKVLGASIRDVILLLSTQFMKWVIFANILAWPISWFVIHLWLQEYAYRTPIGAMPFIVSALLALGLSLLTISANVVRSARSNPVESLRYE